jgi:hypothetical protein
LRDLPHNDGAGGFDQAGQFVQRIAMIGMIRKLHADENGVLAVHALLTVVE